jgi:hypothetical protein
MKSNKSHYPRISSNLRGPGSFRDSREARRQ